MRWREATSRLKLVASLLAGLALGWAMPASAQEISGPAEVVDGDTLSLTGTRVRLFGIDAPELSQSCDRGGEAWACGETAKDELARLLRDVPVVCVAHDTDAYGRLVATCRVGRTDLGEAMVASGWATAFTQYSSDYVEAEARAKQFKLGIWSTSFEAPAAWRAAHPRATPRTAPSAAPDLASKPTVYRDAAGRCAIKGNHSRKGEWIYHLPGQTYYDRTRPEALFCTEEAAQRAGYRQSKV